MKFLFRLFRRLLVILILTGIMGTILCAGVGWYLWQNSHSWMTKLTQQALSDKFPGWPIQITSATIDGDGRIRINDLVIRSPVYGDEMILIPELHLQIDRQLFLEQQQISLSQVRLRNPLVNVVKRQDHTLNLLELPPLKQADNSIFPDIVIESGTINSHLSPANSVKSINLICDQINTTIKVDSQKILSTSGTCMLGPVGQINYVAEYSLKSQDYLLQGDLPRVVAGNDLINLLLTLAPEYEQVATKLDTRNFQLADQHLEQQLTQSSHNLPDQKQHSVPTIKQVSQSNITTTGTAPPATADFGTELSLKANFELASRGQPAKPAWKANVDIDQGRIIHPAMPFPLYYISGGVAVDHQGLRIRSLHATYGQTELNIAGQLSFPLKPTVDGIDISLDNLMINDRLRAVLSVDQKKVYDELNVEGPCDFKAKIFPKQNGKFDWFLTSMLLKNCQSTLARFPYPVTSVNGVIWQDPQKTEQTLVLFKLTGMAGDQPINAQGGIVNPGPGFESIIDVGIKNVPIDDTLRKALPPSVRKTLEEMKLRGRTDIVARLVRPPVNGKPFQIMLSGDLRDGSMNWSLFPYDVKQLSGSLRFVDDYWTFTNIQGMHDSTTIEASGFYAPKDHEEMLKFNVIAKKGFFNQTLEHAISSCGKSLQQLWQELNPAGSFDLDVTLKRKPNAPLEVYFNRLETTSADLLIKNFPYRLSSIETLIKGPIHDLEIERFQAKNGPTSLVGKGRCEIQDQTWKMRVYDFHVDDLLPDHAFRAAVAKPLRDAIEGLALKDKISLSGDFSLQGSCNNPTHAIQLTWNMETVLSGIQLMAGIEFKNIHGKVESKGSYSTNTGISAVGQLNLDSLETNGYQILKLRGPFEMQGTELILGAKRMFDSNSKQLLADPPTPEERITGKLFDGVVTVDAISLMNKQSPYRVRLTLTEGKLEKWAQLSGNSSSGIRGNMNGWVDIQGDVNWKQTQVGRGRFWISPAEIYELPILIRIFRALSFVPPDKTAFRYAFADFHMNGNQFLFDHIDLIGEAISLVGNGYISFDRRVALDFDSLVPRSQIPIPILNNLINSRLIRGTSKGIISVTVRGNLDNPDIKVDAGVPIVDEAVRGFTRTIERGTNEIMPLLVPPPQFTNPNPADVHAKTGQR